MADGGDSLSGVDSAWLRMEEPGNPMVIVALIRLAGELPIDRLVEVLSERFVRYHRFRQRPVETHLGASHWLDDPAFDVARHLIRERLPPPGGEAALRSRISELLAEPIPHELPMWRIHLIEGAGEGSDVVVRIHHAYGDGSALLNVLLSLTEGPPPGPLHRPILHLHEHEALEAALHPSRALELARRGASGAAALGRLLLLHADPPTLLRRPPSGTRRVAWTRPLPLAGVREIGRSAKATINDLLVAALAGSLRHYLQGRGEKVDGLSFRAIVPVDLRPPEEAVALGNQFGLVFLDLPVGLSGPRHRLLEAKSRIEALKRTPEAVVAFKLLHAMGIATPQFEWLGVKLFGSKASVVLTNVPGPTVERSFGGIPIRSILFWVPASAGITFGASLFSYAGNLQLAIGTDGATIPDPTPITADFERELQRFA